VEIVFDSHEEVFMSDIVILPGAGKTVHLGGLGVVYKLSGAETGGSFALVEHPLEPGTLAAPPHLHHNEDEYSYVLEGEVTVLVGERVIQATPGTLIAKPRGIFHTFLNASTVAARVLEIIAPAGLERYFEEVAELAAAGVPPDDSRRMMLAQKYNVEFDRSRIMELVQKYNLKLPSAPR
jgi:mannose-6-phosphate isomerase-like protein (cupin superfamily)